MMRRAPKAVPRKDPPSHRQRRSRENCDAIPVLLALEDRVISRLQKRLDGKYVVFEIEFLQADDVRLRASSQCWTNSNRGRRSLIFQVAIFMRVASLGASPRGSVVDFWCVWNQRRGDRRVANTLTLPGVGNLKISPAVYDHRRIGQLAALFRAKRLKHEEVVPRVAIVERHGQRER